MIQHSQKNVYLATLFALFALNAHAGSVTDIRDFFAPGGKLVTPASYPTDETSRQILQTQTAVGVNQFHHKRKLTPTDDQPVVRMNRDTYYSMAIVNVSSGATITLPEIPVGKYMSMQPVTEDHRIQPMSYGPGTYELAVQSAAETHIHVAPLMTSGPPNGGCSSGRMIGANTQLMNRWTAGTRVRARSIVTAKTANGTRIHNATVRPRRRMPAGITSAPRWSALRLSSAE